jgi:hypothetical protein
MLPPGFLFLLMELLEECKAPSAPAAPPCKDKPLDGIWNMGQASAHAKTPVQASFLFYGLQIRLVE